MIRGLIMKLQDQKTTNALEYMLFSILSLLAIMMVTEPFAICGDDEVVVTAYQMIGYMPQAVMLVAGPFLTCIIYAEQAPAKWKAAKLGINGLLFAVSLAISTHYGMVALEAVFGSVEKQLIVLPIMFYLSLAVGIESVLSEQRN